MGQGGHGSRGRGPWLRHLPGGGTEARFLPARPTTPAPRRDRETAVKPQT